MKALTVLESPLPAACCVPLDAPTLSEDEASAAATVFKALGDPARVRIVNMLANAGEGVCVCDLTPHLGLSQPTVSHHLRKLAGAGLLDREQRGTWSFYSLNAAALDQLRLLTTFAEALA